MRPHTALTNKRPACSPAVRMSILGPSQSSAWHGTSASVHARILASALQSDATPRSPRRLTGRCPWPQARETVVAWLEQRGLFRGRAGNAMRLGLCSRSKDVIEPVLKPQVTRSSNSFSCPVLLRRP